MYQEAIEYYTLFQRTILRLSTHNLERVSKAANIECCKVSLGLLELEAH